MKISMERTEHTSSFSTVLASGNMKWFPENLMGRNPGSEPGLAFSAEAEYASKL
jgi:hypothetical protein